MNYVSMMIMMILLAIPSDTGTKVKITGARKKPHHKVLNSEATWPKC